MAIFIKDNPIAIVSQAALGTSRNRLDKTIERLSTGMRINHAGDDASGMAVSDRMEGQIRGIAVASRNAQDGISMLQTAEGGLESLSGMLTRMRELAVQAGNGVYTTNDRAQLQLEVDQLKQEIDRMSSTVTFNTKSLLNGHATALWSANTGVISAIITGTVKGGNYGFEVKPSSVGSNDIFTTGVFQIKAGQFAAGRVNSSTDHTNLFTAKSINLKSVTGTSYYSVQVAKTAVAGVFSNSLYKSDGTNWSFATSVTHIYSAPATAAGKLIANVTNSGYLEYRVKAVGSTNIHSVTESASAVKAIEYRFINAKTGEVGDWSTVGVTISFNSSLATGTAANDANYAAAIANGGVVAANKGITQYMSVIINTDSVGTFRTSLTGTRYHLGDAFMVSTQSPGKDATSSGGGSITISGGPSGTSIDPAHAIAVTFTVAGSLTPKENKDDKIDSNTVKVYLASLDVGGNLNLGGLALSFGEQPPITATSSYGLTKTGVSSVQVFGGGDPATLTTDLSQIKQFWNDDGINVLTTAKEITIFADGQQGKFTIEGGDTMFDLGEKLRNTMKSISLGASLSGSFGDGNIMNQINSNLVRFVGKGYEKEPYEQLTGSLVIQTTLMGSRSNIDFIADQSIIDALQLQKVREGANTQMDVLVRNSDNNKIIGRDSIENNTLYAGIIPGVEVHIDSRTGVEYKWNSNNNTIQYFGRAGAEKHLLHITDNKTSMQIGPEEGQIIDASIPQLDIRGLRVEDAYVISQFTAAKAITKFNEAIQRVVSIRAVIGAQTNRMDYTMKNLDVQRFNYTAAKSRILDADVASESSALAQNRVQQESSTAMLVQANSLTASALRLINGQ